MDKTELGDRMKMYERLETNDHFMPLCPVVARIDGRAFHSFCKDMGKPFDFAFTTAMDCTARYVLEQTGAKLAYVQSDEINLFWHSVDVKSQIFFNGKKHKMVSQLAALATAKMTEIKVHTWPEKPLPTFDARVWQLPWAMEVMNYFLWRQRDSIKNSVSMLASCHFSPKQLHGKTHNERLQMLLEEKDVLWQDLPERCKSGVFFRKEPYFKNVDGERVQRTRIANIYTEMDKLQDRVGFVYGDPPILIGEVNDQKQ